MKEIENFDSKRAQMRKGVLSYAVLLSIKKSENAYSTTILKDLKEANLIVVEGTLYPLLSRFKREEILEYEWQESDSGPPRKYYKLTEKGEKFLKILKKTWSELVQSIKTLH